MRRALYTASGAGTSGGSWYNGGMNPIAPLPGSVADLARRRRSCRSFASGGLDAETRGRIERLFPELPAPFATPLRFGFIDAERVRATNFFSTGTYGMIKGAQLFAAAVMPRRGEHRWEDLGFALETLVLHLTAMEVDTCWIGGVFDRKRFGRELGVADDEQLPAVIAVGRAAAARTLRDRIVRWGARGDQRLPFSRLFFDGAFDQPLAGDADPGLAAALEIVRLAPSASNKQPWRLLLDGASVHLFLARDAAYRRIIPGVDLQRIDAGIAMSHFSHSLAEQGRLARWHDAGQPPPAGELEYVASAHIDLPQAAT